jgi:regulatory protein CII
MEIITLFNNKGGVSKTTTTFNIAWKLAQSGKRILMVDADPQCNLTELVINPLRSDDSVHTKVQGQDNIYSALDPVYNARPKQLEPVNCISVNAQDNLFLLPGHPGFAEYENTLSIAHQLSETLGPVRNVPGSLHRLINLTAAQYEIDYVFIDVSPSLGALNQNIVTTSNRLIVPLCPDLFSGQAIDTLSRTLPKWVEWAKRASQLDILKDADYPFPETSLKFTGYIIQRYKLRNNSPTQAFSEFFDDLKLRINDKLIPSLAKGELIKDATLGAEDFLLAQIPEFNTLIAASQGTGKPVFALSQADTGHSGKVWDNDKRKIDELDDLFNDFTQRVIS